MGFGTQVGVCQLSQKERKESIGFHYVTKSVAVVHVVSHDRPRVTCAKCRSYIGNLTDASWDDGLQTV